MVWLELNCRAIQLASCICYSLQFLFQFQYYTRGRTISTLAPSSISEFLQISLPVLTLHERGSLYTCLLRILKWQNPLGVVSLHVLHCISQNDKTPKGHHDRPHWSRHVSSNFYIFWIPPHGFFYNSVMLIVSTLAYEHPSMTILNTKHQRRCSRLGWPTCTQLYHPHMNS